MEGPAAVVLVLDASRASRRWAQARMTTNAGLNAGFLIGADNVVVRAKELALPDPSVQIQHPASLLLKLGVAGKNPVFVPPGFDRISVQNAADGGAADGLPQSGAGLRSQVGQRQATQRQRGLGNCFTGDGFDYGFVPRGKNGVYTPVPFRPPKTSGHWPSVFARGERSWGADAPEPLLGG